MSDKYDLIREAIISKSRIEAYYHGKLRELCPHVLGTKDGRQAVFSYQCAGHSSSGLSGAGSPANWRCMFVDELEGVQAIDGEWVTAHGHSESQRCVDEIDVEVEY